MNDERIDHLADLVVRGMPDGLRGFASLWEWQQFARALLSDCGVADSPVPLDMVLHCPSCHLQHIGAPEPAVEHEHGAVEFAAWDNPPHRSHLCHGCGHVWRPADVPTNGVRAVKTRGRDDS